MKKIIISLFCSLPVIGFGQNILLYNDGAMVKVQAGAVLTIEGGLQNTATGTIDNEGIIEVQGNFINAGTWTPGQPNTLRFSGPDDSDVTSGPAVFQTVEVIKDDGANVNLMDPMTIDTDLDFNSAGASKVVLGNNDLILQNTTTVTGADADEYIVTAGTGMVQKNVTADANFSFPVGDASNFTPLACNYTGSAYTNANLRAKVNNMTHPDIPADATDFIARYWDIDQTGITNYSDSLTGTYVPADLTGTASLVKGAVYDGANWVYAGAANGSNLVKAATNIANADFTGTNFFGRVDLTVFLSGAMPGSGNPPMTTTLNNAPSLIPLSSPYSVSPWNAPAATASSIPANTTDWILVESRDPSINVVSQTSAFLKNDGTIVGLDGGPLRMKDALPNSIISIRHRNHLGIRTINALDLAASPATNWNFSTGTGQAYTNPGITTNANMRLVGSTYCLWGGNANISTSNALIQVRYNGLGNDPGAILTAMGGNPQNNQNGVYSNADLNLNRNITYNGLNNDPAIVLQNTGGNVQNIYTQHLQ